MRKNWLQRLLKPSRQWIPSSVLIGTLTLTALATFYVEKSAKDKDQIRFQNLIQRTEESIENRIETHIAVLRGGAGLFSASEMVDRQEFRAYVNRLLLEEQYPGVQGVGFAKQFSAAERNAINAALDNEELQDVTLDPDFERSVYYPIIYIEPLDRRNQAAVGYDMFTEPTRRAAMALSRDTGLPVASGKVTLVQEIDDQKQAGFLVYVPVYEEGAIPNTVAERQAQLEGFVYSAFRVDDLMEAVFDPTTGPLIDFQVYDGLEPNPESLLHSSQSQYPLGNANYDPRFTAMQTAEVAGRLWTITYASRPLFDQTSSIGLVPYVAIGGTIISLTLFGVTRAQLEARLRAEQAVAKLQRSEQDLQQARSELEHRVAQRTDELAQANGILHDQMIALRQTQESLQQAFSFEALLKRITDRVRDSLDETQILQTVVEELALGLQVAACNTGLYNLDEHTTTICAEYTTAFPSSLGHTIDMADFPKGYQQLLTGQPFQDCSADSAVQHDCLAMLACPIFDDQGMLGDLWLFREPGQTFNDLEVRLVEQVATQCAIALRQARLYEASQTQVKALEKLNWLKDDFLSTVSHELRTPVSNMKLSIRMLDLTLGQAEALNGHRTKVQQYLQILQTECQREIELINDLLDLQRLVSGKAKLDLQTVDLESWLFSFVQSFEHRAQTRHQHFKVELHLTANAPLVADMTSLERVVGELLNNACKYTPPGETITLSVWSQAGQAEFAVCNSGVEIPDHELPRIFDKFYRVPKADPWNQGGTGLGLALAQRLVEHMQGNIHVESSQGRTMFTVTIPNQVVLERV